MGWLVVLLHSQIRVCEINVFIQIRKTFTNVHTHIGIRKTRNWFRYETFIYFLSLRRERHNFFNKRAIHFVDPNWSRRGETKNRLPSSRLESQLSRSEFKSQLTDFFSNSKILSTSRHDVIHVPDFISYQGFLLWHLWLSHPPSARVNTCTQSVHLTNPCTKRKVLSLTKPKGKIYKTKNDNIKKKYPSAMILQFGFHGI